MKYLKYEWVSLRSLIGMLLIMILNIFFCSCKNEVQKDQIEKKVDFFTNKQYEFIEVDSAINMAYLDIGKKNDPLVLLLHGEPSSSFVYRNIAPLLVAQNFRVVIPDLVGFGYSDKPKNSEVITYSNHTKWLRNFINYLELKDINLFAHDWGGMLALRIVAGQPEIFKKVAISYCYLFDGDELIPDSFKGFVNYAKTDATFSAGNIMDWGSNVKLAATIKEAYDRPFQKPSDYYAIRKFPSMIPMNEHDPEAIINKNLNKKLNLFSKPFITIWGNNEDLMWKGKDSLLQKSIRGAKNQKHFRLDANHFIQEDRPVELTQILIDFFK